MCGQPSPFARRHADRLACGKWRLCQRASVRAGGLFMSLTAAGLDAAEYEPGANVDAEIAPENRGKMRRNVLQTYAVRVPSHGRSRANALTCKRRRHRCGSARRISVRRSGGLHGPRRRSARHVTRRSATQRTPGRTGSTGSAGRNDAARCVRAPDSSADSV